MRAHRGPTRAARPASPAKPAAAAHALANGPARGPSARWLLTACARPAPLLRPRRQATAAALVGAVLISDCMFLDYSQFDFDPEFKNWERRVSPKY